MSGFCKDVKFTQLSFLLFAYFCHESIRVTQALLKNKEQISTLPTKLSELYKRTEKLSLGLLQALQNTVFHSQYKSGYFTLRAHKASDGDAAKYLAREYGFDASGINTKGKKTTVPLAVEIIVQDIGQDSGILETFGNKLTNEKKDAVKTNDTKAVAAIDDLITTFSSLKLAHLCRDFDVVACDADISEKWREYIKHSPAMHTGLSTLRTSTNALNGFLKIASMAIKPEGIYASAPYIYSAFPNKHVENRPTSASTSSYIPGTLIQVIVPAIDNVIDTQSSGGSFEHPVVSATYADFASFLDAKAINVARFNIDYIYQETQGEQAKKDKLSADFKIELLSSFSRMIKMSNCYVEHYAKPIMFWLDIDRLLRNATDPNTFECFAKGLVSAIATLEKTGSDKILYFALINVPLNALQFLKSFIYSSAICAVRFFGSLQLFIHNVSEHQGYILQGGTFADAINFEFVTGLQRGQQMFVEDMAQYRARSLSEGVDGNRDNKLFPFEALLPSDDYAETLMHRALLGRFARDHTREGTHIRLGSKVHLDIFREVSYVFEEPLTANYIAYALLRRLRKEKIIDIYTDSLLFYGYTTYSGEIANSLVQMCRANNAKADVCQYTRALFQSNLSMQSTESSVLLQFSHDDLKLTKDYKIIQIVPIATTFSTFDKITAQLLSADHWNEEVTDVRKSLFVYNYNVFWIRDHSGKNPHDILLANHSDLENDYWKTYMHFEVVANTEHFKDLFPSKINVSMIAFAHYYNPVDCELCYPTVLTEERPIIETDATSTIPSQQNREIKPITRGDFEPFLFNKNFERVVMLENCVRYGHIVRGEKHFQFYLDTGKYYHKCAIKIKEWLYEQIVSIDKLRFAIIFAPINLTNIELPQLVNDIVYNGVANFLRVNTDAKYRSNFKIEHTSLMNALATFLESTQDAKIELCFVDDAIITGDTYHRANTLVRELLPKDRRNNIVVFDRAFVLLNRMSRSSIASLIDPEKYHAFCNINISSLRVKGDSCIACKLHDEYRTLFWKSSTEEMANFWANKVFTSRLVSFDSENEYEKSTDDAFARLISTHLLNTIAIPLVNSINPKEGLMPAYDALLDLLYEICENSDYYGIKLRGIAGLSETEEGELSELYLYLNRVVKCTPELQAKHFLKTLARPFASFDERIRKVAIQFFLRLTEAVLTGDNSTPEGKLAKSYTDLFTNNGKVVFLIDYLLEGLVDLKSAYLLNTSVIKKVAYYLEVNKGTKKDYVSIAALVKRAVTTCKDESKSVHLRNSLAEMEVSACDILEKSEYCGCFLSLLSVENTRVLYDGTAELTRKVDLINNTDQYPYLGSYYLSAYRKELELINNKDATKLAEKLVALHKRITDMVSQHHIFQHGASNEYKGLINAMHDVLTTAYDGKEFELQLWVGPASRGEVVEPSHFECIHAKIIRENYAEKEICLAHARDDLVNTKTTLQGYFCCQNNECMIFVFDSNVFCEIANKIIDKDLARVDELFHRRGNSALPVFLHVHCKDHMERKSLDTIARLILGYRNRLIRIFEVGYANTALPESAIQLRAAIKLANPRAIVHADEGTFTERSEIIQNHKLDLEIRKVTNASYVNDRIYQLYGLYTASYLNKNNASDRELLELSTGESALTLNSVFASMLKPNNSTTGNDIHLTRPLVYHTDIHPRLRQRRKQYRCGTQPESISQECSTHYSDLFGALDPIIEWESKFEKFRIKQHPSKKWFFLTDYVYAIVAEALSSATKHGKEQCFVNIWCEGEFLCIENETKSLKPGETICAANVRISRLLYEPIAMPTNLGSTESGGLSLRATAWYVWRVNAMLAHELESGNESPSLKDCISAQYREADNNIYFTLKLRILEVTE